MTLHDITNLLSYDRWAMRLQLQAARALASEEYLAYTESPLGGLHHTFVHIYAAERLWLSRWLRHEAARLMSPADVPSLPQLEEWWVVLWREQDVFMESLSEHAVQERLTYVDLEGRTCTTALIHQIQHMLNHSNYHRGEIFTMLWRLGIVPPNLDLIDYYQNVA